MPRNLFHEAWARLHRNKIHTIEWFSAWLASLPPNGCNCNYDEAITAVPVRYNDWFRWSVDLHNWVNRTKTHKRELSYEEAEQIWIEHPSRLLAVTSLSPLACHRESERAAIKSWQAIGLEILSVNLPEETARLASEYPDIAFAIGEPASGFGRRTPTINSLLDHGYGRDILLVNSDCSIHAEASVLVAPSVLLRYNWKAARQNTKREQWGLDAFVLTPDLVRTIPRLPFGIGQPMWDYWIAWHLEQHCDLNWIGEPVLFHKAHGLNWTPNDCWIGREWIKEHYGATVDWEKWRESRPYAYSEFSLTRDLRVQKSEWEEQAI